LNRQVATGELTAVLHRPPSWWKGEHLSKDLTLSAVRASGLAISGNPHNVVDGLVDGLAPMDKAIENEVDDKESNKKINDLPYCVT